MTPHHQGAIDMAKIALENGKDRPPRKLAQDIILSDPVPIERFSRSVNFSQSAWN
jgi:uncharacterized protein (DUF305 family)